MTHNIFGSPNYAYARAEVLRDSSGLHSCSASKWCPPRARRTSTFQPCAWWQAPSKWVQNFTFDNSIPVCRNWQKYFEWFRKILLAKVIVYADLDTSWTTEISTCKYTDIYFYISNTDYAHCLDECTKKFDYFMINKREKTISPQPNINEKLYFFKPKKLITMSWWIVKTVYCSIVLWIGGFQILERDCIICFITCKYNLFDSSFSHNWISCKCSKFLHITEKISYFHNHIYGPAKKHLKQGIAFLSYFHNIFILKQKHCSMG